jgi:heat shock protein HslJ
MKRTFCLSANKGIRLKNRLAPYLLCSCILVWITGCTPGNKKNNTGDITESDWGLVTVTTPNGGVLNVPVNSIMLTLKVGTAGNVRGSSGCNSFDASVAVTGHNLQFGDFVRTHLACPDSVLEAAFFNALDATDNYTVAHGHLQLKKGTRIVATFMPLDYR